ncbi:AAA family ATPase [Ectothiorhodospiraceae bacterium BW-2]|nr:AAA family ATPase [Ectothiorhodospiraceae bacterium BW-2]
MSDNYGDIAELIAQGEDSFTQYKANIHDSKKLAEEMVAFSNAEGGVILVGIGDNGEIIGVTSEDIHRLNQLISNTANENIKPPIYPLVQLEQLSGKQILIIRVRKGSARPYATSSGHYLTKSGADKRKMSPEELKRLFAESGGLSADESVINGSTMGDLNSELIYQFLEKRDNPIYQDLVAERIALTTVCENLDLIKNNEITLAGNLLFGKVPQRLSRSFYVQCVHIDGNDISSEYYLSRDNFYGTLSSLYSQTLNFIKSSLQRRQNGNRFNSPGELEIPEICLIEAIINALIHRDYYINSTIKVLLFTNRLEIISPGKLPNSLTVDKIRSGLSIHRNPILNSIGQYLLPYSGLGSGIRRIEKNYPEVEFLNDSDKEQFCCRFWRDNGSGILPTAQKTQ